MEIDRPKYGDASKCRAHTWPTFQRRQLMRIGGNERWERESVGQGQSCRAWCQCDLIPVRATVVPDNVVLGVDNGWGNPEYINQSNRGSGAEGGVPGRFFPELTERRPPAPDHHATASHRGTPCQIHLPSGAAALRLGPQSKSNPMMR